MDGVQLGTDVIRHEQAIQTSKQLHPKKCWATLSTKTSLSLFLIFIHWAWKSQAREIRKAEKALNALELQRCDGLDLTCFEKPPAGFLGVGNRPSARCRNKIHFVYAWHELSKQKLIKILTFQRSSWYLNRNISRDHCTWYWTMQLLTSEMCHFHCVD